MQRQFDSELHVVHRRDAAAREETPRVSARSSRRRSARPASRWRSSRRISPTGRSIEQAQYESRCSGSGRPVRSRARMPRRLRPSNCGTPASQRLASTLTVAQQKRVRSAIVAGALASDTQNFSASDTVWEQLFRLPAKDILSAQGVTGVIVPASQIVTNPDIVSAAQLATFYGRFGTPSTGHGTSTGVHGSDLLVHERRRKRHLDASSRRRRRPPSSSARTSSSTSCSRTPATSRR